MQRFLWILNDNPFKIHHRNLQKLAIEIFKVKLGLAAEIMNNVFPINQSPYDLRNKTKFKSWNDHIAWYDIETAYCDFKQDSKKL